MHSGLFGCLTKLGAKRAELVQKFVPRSRVRIFRNKRTRSTPSDPKLTFCCILYYLGAFGTVWLPYETRCRTGRTSPKVCATGRVRIIRNECTRSTLLDPKLTFWCVSDCLVALQNSVQNGPCKSSCREVASEFFAMNAPDPPHWTLS